MDGQIKQLNYLNGLGKYYLGGQMKQLLNGHDGSSSIGQTFEAFI